jgi:hypothetical protein
MEKSIAEIGKEANIYARRKTLKAAKKAGVTIDKFMQRLNEALDAEEVKVFNDKDSGIVYSDPLIAHQIRVKALELTAVILDLKPVEKREVTGNNGGPIGIAMEAGPGLLAALERIRAATKPEGAE